MRNRIWIGSLLLLMTCSIPAIADFETGMRAYKRGDYVAALKEWRPLAEQGAAAAQQYLGFVYKLGQGVSQDCKEAAKWYREAARRFRMAAEQGDAAAQYHLGSIYLGEPGVPKDYEEAVKWSRMAAEQGYRPGQAWFGTMYLLGIGVPQDYVQAHMWFNLAAADDTGAGVTRDKIAKLMTPVQIGKAQEMASTWRPTTVTKTPHTSSLPGQSKGTERVGSGTGFVVSTQGHVMTNYHVVEGCSTLIAKTSTGSQKLNLMARDTSNDFALLGFLKSAPSVLTFSDNQRVKLGQSIFAAGYPLQGLLASSLNLTTGNISALAGIQDDTRMFQVTAPVQPGNSGGPLLDQSGNVVGVIARKLDALKVAKVLGDLPQNINFAIKGSLACGFLDTNGVDYLTAPSTMSLSTPAIAEKANKAVILVECWK